MDGHRPIVRLGLPDGGVVELGHGDLIGRLESAALVLSDPRISEVHAMVSLRGSTLKLLAMRGRFTVNAKPAAEVELVAGLEIRLARGLSLKVIEVRLPDVVPAVRVAGTLVRVLGGVCSLFGLPRPELKAGFHADAIAHVWTERGGIQIRRAGHPDARLLAGDAMEVEGVEVAVIEMALQGDGQYVTTARGAVAAAIEIVTRYHSVHIFRAEEPALVLSGISGRILSELVSFGVPVTWSTAAREIWPDETDDVVLRRKWDVSLTRLRRKLEAARIRSDLVRSDGRGNFELSLEKSDTVRDES